MTRPWLNLMAVIRAAPSQALATTWTWDFPALLSMEVTTFLYIFGVFQVWQRAGRGHGVRVSQVAAFAGGMAALFIALISPIDALSSVLFSAHMLQHLVLILIAAPLLALSGLPVALMWALPRRWARRVGQAHTLRSLGRLFTRPWTAWLLAIGVLWLWHLPGFYEAALVDSTIHGIEHLSFLVSAMLFWWVLLDLMRQRSGTHSGLGVLYLFSATIANGVLGALLTFATQPWYPAYGTSARLWGLSAMEDQQLAGALMWLPGGVLYSALAAGMFVQWLNALDRRMAVRSG